MASQLCFGKGKGMSRAQVDHDSERSDNENDEGRVDLGYVLDRESGTRHGVAPYISISWWPDPKRLGRPERKAPKG